MPVNEVGRGGEGRGRREGREGIRGERLVSQYGLLSFQQQSPLLEERKRIHTFVHMYAQTD